MRNGLRRFGGAARLVRGEPEQVPGVGIARVDLENLPIDFLGARQLAALVVREGDRHELRLVVHGVAWRDVFLSERDARECAIS